MFLDNCSAQSSLKKAVKAPLEVTAFRLQGQWPELPEAIRAFSNLEVLILKGVGLEKLPKWLAELPRLKALDLSNSQVTRLVPLPALLELRILYLNDAPEGIKDLESLRILNLGYGDMDRLPELPPQLEDLILTSLPLTTLPALPGSLRSLKLGQCKISSLPELPALRELELQWNPVRAVGSLPATLEHLRLDRTAWDGAPLPPLPRLRYLDLGFNAHPLPEDLPRFPLLESLLACECGLEAVPENIGELENLTWLNLNVNRLRALPASLARLSRLVQLDVKANLLTTLPDLSHLPLRDAMVGGNPLPPEEVARCLPSGCRVDTEDAGLLLSRKELAANLARQLGLPPAAALVPLRVPAGWMVYHNDFREEPQTARDQILFGAVNPDGQSVTLEAGEGLYRLRTLDECSEAPDWTGAVALLEAALSRRAADPHTLQGPR